MKTAIITALFSLSYFAVTLWLVRKVKLDVRSICSAGVICALLFVIFLQEEILLWFWPVSGFRFPQAPISPVVPGYH